METLNRTGAVIFMLFLATAAWQDLRKKSVEVRVFVVFGAAAFLWNILIIWYMAGFPGEPETITGTGEIIGTRIKERMAGCLVGAVLLVLAWTSRGGIGAGDGCFFLVSGLLLEAGQNFCLFLAGLFLCGLWSLGVFTRERLAGHAGSGRITLAFLPFVAAAGIAGTAAGFIGK
ncbi:MAG: hypothetical protein HFG62_10880 [Lachnospiraceae bacterium]|jgi:leader peptidase (prepilin peptidase)/N-methyltransferase|nr:hypothetical protein [Lachnospiraceae bacterium]MCI8959606.1 hypothetical protein [Lachnospiraceae bacterium]